ncbi:hypothetical protein OQA88_2146 [Cercophora sp. LCS_1]
MEEQAVDNSSELLGITEEFRPLQEFLFFVNYTEGKLMRGMSVPLVDEARGWMDAPRKVELKLPDGDHLGICKFGRNQHDQLNFELVIAHLKDLVGASKALEHIGEQAAAALASLCPKGFHGYFMAKQATMGTCGWIEEREAFQKWIGDDKENQMLWIQGPPASGKSFLARHILTDLIPPSTQKIAHCFLDDSVPGRSSLEDLLRATLHHALRVEPELIQLYLVPPFMKATQNTVIQVPDHEIWTQDVVVPLWPQVVARVTERGILTVVVDGFDEMSVECRQGFLDCLDAFEEKAESMEHRERLRVLLVSRENPDEDEQLNGRDKFQVYKLTPDDTKDDMVKTIMATITDSQNWDEGEPPVRQGLDLLEALGKEKLDDMCEAIVSGSEGNYSLAKMITQEITPALIIDDVASPAELLQDLPTDVEGIYDRILGRMRQDETYLPFSRHVLRWAAYQKEPLKEAELDTAIALGMAQDRRPDHQVSGDDLETFERMLGNVRPMVEKHCRRVVEIQEGQLQPVHEILKERLASEESNELHLEEGPSHATLASLCTNYLTMPYFQDSRLPVADSQDDKVKERISQHPFSRYAALHWRDHVAASGLSWLGVEDHTIKAQGLLNDESTEYAISCSEIQWYLTRGTMKGHRAGGSGDSVASAAARTASSTQLSHIGSLSIEEVQPERSETSHEDGEVHVEVETASQESELKQRHKGIPALPEADRDVITAPQGELGSDGGFSGMVEPAPDTTYQPIGVSQPLDGKQDPKSPEGLMETDEELPWDPLNTTVEDEGFAPDLFTNQPPPGTPQEESLESELETEIAEVQLCGQPEVLDEVEVPEKFNDKKPVDSEPPIDVDVKVKEPTWSQAEASQSLTSPDPPEEREIADDISEGNVPGIDIHERDIPPQINESVEHTKPISEPESNPKITEADAEALHSGMDITEVEQSQQDEQAIATPASPVTHDNDTETTGTRVTGLDNETNKIARASDLGPAHEAAAVAEPPSEDNPVEDSERPSNLENVKSQVKEGIDAAQAALEYLFPDRMLIPRRERIEPENDDWGPSEDHKQERAVVEKITETTGVAGAGGAAADQENGESEARSEWSRPAVEQAGKDLSEDRRAVGVPKSANEEVAIINQTQVLPLPVYPEAGIDESEHEASSIGDGAGEVGRGPGGKKKSGFLKRFYKGTKKVGKKIVKGVRGK